MSIFSILMSISPGKAINITTSGWIGDAKRRSPPHTAPRMTPIRKEKKYESIFCPHQMNSSRDTPYSSTVAWKIPWMEEPGRLQSMGSLRVGHD